MGESFVLKNSIMDMSKEKRKRRTEQHYESSVRSSENEDMFNISVCEQGFFGLKKFSSS